MKAFCGAFRKCSLFYKLFPKTNDGQEITSRENIAHVKEIICHSITVQLSLLGQLALLALLFMHNKAIHVKC